MSIPGSDRRTWLDLGSLMSSPYLPSMPISKAISWGRQQEPVWCTPSPAGDACFLVGDPQGYVSVLVLGRELEAAAQQLHALFELAEVHVTEAQALREAAKEILAEIFSTDISDVEDMIRMRCEEKESWPEGLWVEGWDPA